MNSTIKFHVKTERTNPPLFACSHQLLDHNKGEGRGAGAGTAGPADQCSHKKVEINMHVPGILIGLQRRRLLTRMRRLLQAFIYTYSARLLRTQAAIATGPVMHQNRIRSDLRRPEIQNFLEGGMPPDPPSQCASRVRLFSTILSTQFPRRTSANELPSPLEGTEA